MGWQATNMICLRPLLAELGWSDASTDTESRLTARAGNLGLVVKEDGSVDIMSVDPFTKDVVTINVSGGWSFATIKNLIMHLMIIDTIRGGMES